MNAIADQPSIGWLMVVVAVWTVAVATIVLALVIVGPELWRAPHASGLRRSASTTSSRSMNAAGSSGRRVAGHAICNTRLSEHPRAARRIRGSTQKGRAREMGLLKTAVVEQAAAKVGIFGGQGSGKTTTSALILLALSKLYHKSAPVAFMDTENGSDYLVPIFEAEKVPLLVVKSRAFKDMMAFVKEAEESGCSGALVDSYTHPWQELNESLKKQLKVNRLEFRHMDQLKQMWRGWTDLMLNSPLHIVMSGRLGYVWDKEEDENGKKTELVKLGTKMKSESEAGYEPSLLIEMEGIQSEAARTKKTRAKQGSIVHHAYVLKDRWRTLNGRTFTWKDMNDYKAGDYEKIFKEFRPHFDKLAIGVEQRAVNPARTSAALFDGGGDSAYQQRARRVQIVLEEIEGTLTALWPGQDAKSKELKRLAVETLFATRSWTAVSAMPLERLDAALDAFKLFEEGVKDGPQANALTDATAAAAFLTMCKERVADEAKEAGETVGIL